MLSYFAVFYAITVSRYKINWLKKETKEERTWSVCHGGKIHWQRADARATNAVA